ncbi:hypothetical protein CR513_00403, partial [Mucuna pruriens]
MILDKDNRARVMHYESVDPMKEKKFSKQIKRSHVQFHLVCPITTTTSKRLQQANLLMMVAKKEFLLPQRHKTCNQRGHVCKCKDGTMICFNYVKQGCIGKDHPNLKKELNSRDQSLLVNQLKKFMREDVHVYATLASLKVEKKATVVDVGQNRPSHLMVEIDSATWSRHRHFFSRNATKPMGERLVFGIRDAGEGKVNSYQLSLIETETDSTLGRVGLRRWVIAWCRYRLGPTMEGFSGIVVATSMILNQ